MAGKIAKKKKARANPLPQKKNERIAAGKAQVQEARAIKRPGRTFQIR